MRLIKETAAYYFIGYYSLSVDITVLANIWYLILKLVSALTNNTPTISCIPNWKYLKSSAELIVPREGKKAN